jgi:hypothetical protein
MDEQVWRMVDERFRRHPKARASAVEASEFDCAIGGAGYHIDPDYKEFVLRYGGGIVGPSPIYGLRKAEFMGTVGGKSTAPELTAWFQAKQWPGIENWLIFSMDQGGNPIGFSSDGKVWLSDQLDFKQIVQLASGFEDYVLKWCLKVKPVE